MGHVPGLDDLTDELYAVPPALFVDARSAVVAAARAAGDTATASRLTKLRKPTVTAWLANRLVRTEPDLVAGALALGPALRDATVAGDRDALRDLTRHRQILLRDLVAAARSLAQDAGQTFTATTQRELEATFTAAAADPTAAAALAMGRLAAPLSSVGLGFELGAVPPDRPAGDRPGGRRTDDTDSSLAAASESSPVASVVTPAPPLPSAREKADAAARDQAVTDAELALATARLQDADATAALADAQAALDAAAAAEKRAAAEHQAARAALSDARADLTAAKADVTSTHRAVASALARLERARTR
jgi:hypothetical protein